MKRLLLTVVALSWVACAPAEEATEETTAAETASDLLVGLAADRNTSPDTLSARDIVLRAIEANGGEAWRRPRTLHLSGKATMTYEGRTDQLDRLETYEMWRVFPSESTAARSANGKVRFDAARTPRATELDDLFFRVAFDGQGSVRHYHPDAERYQEISGWTNSFGFGIFRFADGDDFELTRLANDQVEGHPCFFVRVRDPSGHETDFAVDQKDYSLRQVAFDTPAGFHHRIYSDFVMDEETPFRQPKRVRIYFDGVKWIDIDWLDFEVNADIPDEVFATG